MKIPPRFAVVSDGVAERPNAMVSFAGHRTVLVDILVDGAARSPKSIAGERLPVHIGLRSVS